MKFIPIAAFAALLSACSTFSPATHPTDLAKGAAIGLWTSRPTADVQACVDRVLAQYPSPYRYEVTANDPKKTYMTTTISGFTDGNADPTTTRIAEACLPG